jgi:hypothetical protein
MDNSRVGELEKQGRNSGNEFVYALSSRAAQFVWRFASHSEAATAVAAALWAVP